MKTYTSVEKARIQAKERANAEGRPITIFRIRDTWYVYVVDDTMPPGRPMELEEIFPELPPTEGGWPIV